MQILKKTKSLFLKIWRDPVWSKVISVAILALIAIIWAKITNHTWKELYEVVLKVLQFNLPLYFFLSVIAFYSIVKVSIRFFKNRKDPFWDEQMGNYTFKELHNILLTQNLPVGTLGMEMSGRSAPTDDLLTLFRLYYSFLNKGVDFEDNLDDGSYLYSVLAPRFVGFGLVEEYQKPLRQLPDQTEVAYKTSELGHKFHASIDKLILADKMKELKSKKELTP